MKKLIVLMIACMMLVGCGQASRIEANWTGYSEVCIRGVVYYQFPSGVTPAYNPDGTFVTCK